ncbi:FxSxx-COOH system tetratricopeptide repeat protein [Streptomyces sp. NPDC001156]
MEKQQVYIVASQGEAPLAETLAIPLRDAGYEVVHNGTVKVGQSVIGEATQALKRNVPVVLCATKQAVGSAWTHQIVNAARVSGTPRVFVVQRESDAYVDQLAVNTIVARYCDDSEQAMANLLDALRASFPPKASPPEALNARSMKNGNPQFLDGPSGISEFDFDSLRSFRGELRLEVVEQYPHSLTPWEFLERAGLWVDGVLSLTGALLFAKHPTPGTVVSMVKCVEYFGESRAASRSGVTLEGPIASLIIGARDFVAERVQRGERPSANVARAEAFYRYPMIAVREIIANSVVHRDYSRDDSCVHVRLFSDRLEVASPGDWQGRKIESSVPHTLGDLEGQSVKRNFQLARLLSWTRLVEGEGSGIPTAISDCESLGTDQPTVVQEGHFVLVTLRSGRPDPETAQAAERLFISYATPDRAWAEWVAWQLMDAGYEVELDTWHWGAGGNFVLRMNEALEQGSRMVALYSAAYFEPGRFTTDEWTAVLAARDKLVPLRIEKVTAPPILKSLIYRDMFGLGEEAAREALLAAVRGPAGVSESSPGFPGQRGTRGTLRRVGESGPRVPGSGLPRVWNLPGRNAGFTGRDEALVRTRERLAGTGTVAVLALNGRGGVGKTQLAIEYAHRFSNEYELAWWINAEDPALIPDQLAALAVETGAAQPDTSVDDALQALADELRGRSRWLLVFDNAEDPAALGQYRPDGPGHVLITSRNPRWHGLAAPVDVDTLSRPEAVALLRSRTPQLNDTDADRIAEALEDLPLALVQAAQALTAFTPDQYLDQLADNAAEATDNGAPLGYPHSLAGQIRLSTQRLNGQDPEAVALLNACALLAPDPFPLHACKLPGDPDDGAVARILASPRTMQRTLAALDRHGLARVSGGTVQLHRLTQAVLRDQLTPDQHTQAAEDASRLLAAALPGDPSDPGTWPLWHALLPHLLAISATDLTTTDARYAAGEACRYLMERGQAHVALERIQHLHQTWIRTLGPDLDDTLRAATSLARAYDDTGDHAAARTLDEDSLIRRRRILGEDHPDTLRTANNLAIRLAALGEVEQARALAEDTLARQRRVLGEDHPDTLTTANNLAVRLEALGEVEEARALGEDTLARQRRVLGEDHPNTLRTANNLAIQLADVGQVEEARALGEDTLARRRRVLGEDHPETLTTASNLAIRLADVGQVEEARALGEDTLARRRRVLGEDHPDTLITAELLGLLNDSGEDSDTSE